MKKRDFLKTLTSIIPGLMLVKQFPTIEPEIKKKLLPNKRPGISNVSGFCGGYEGPSLTFYSDKKKK